MITTLGIKSQTWFLGELYLIDSFLVISNLFDFEKELFQVEGEELWRKNLLFSEMWANRIS